MGHRYGVVNLRDPEGAAVCDYSGDICKRSDLVKQMKYNPGGGTYWTGLMVAKWRQDPLDPQDLKPALPADPPPIVNARVMDAGDGEGLLYVKSTNDLTYFIDTGLRIGNTPRELRWT